MKAHSMRELTPDELIQRRRDLEDERFNLNMRRSRKELDTPLRLRHIRRELARIDTLLREHNTNIRPLAQARTTLLGETDAKTDK